MSFVVSCEHASAAVPRWAAKEFSVSPRVLASHRGYDVGALELAHALATRLSAPLHLGVATRLLVDLNRSERHPAVFSSRARRLSPRTRQRLLTELHRPYRARVRASVAERLRRDGRVLHLSIHSFTPLRAGVIRKADLGLLYDPARSHERALAPRLVARLRPLLPGWTIRRNYPYLGRTDGMTTHLRRQFPASAYVGFELEVNQRHLRTPARRAATLARLLPALSSALASMVAEGARGRQARR